jgi:GT2 family glycosyltransferase
MTISSLHRLHGYFEPAHAMWACQKLLEHETPGSIRLAASLLRQAGDICPYDQNLEKLANTLATRNQVAPPFPAPSIPEGIPLHEAMNLVDSKRDSADTLIALLDASPSPTVRHLCLGAIWQHGFDSDIFLQQLSALPESQARSVPFFAWAAYRLGFAQRALDLLDRSPASWLGHNLLAQMAMANGDTQFALAHWAASLALEPAQPHLIEQLAQRDQRVRPLPDPAEHRVHILFYTFNKLDTTLATLRSLLDSDIGPARITLLNNGSTAFSPEEFSSAAASVARGRAVEVIHLPVNIGAPAARNWLYRLPHVQEADYIAFLDDDVLLPRNWLRMYIQDLCDYPDTCAVGPKGINPNPYRTIQYVYRYFQEVGEHKIRFTNNAPMVFDLGQYDGRRPCLSVMGCCHMFDKKRMARLGVPDFDVRFTPSQVDDLERDIQIWKHGGRVLYDGRVEVVHMQDAGRAAPKTEASWGHVWGNHMKMEFKFSGRELRDIDEQIQAVEEKHWQECLAKAWDLLPMNCRAFWEGQRSA